MSFPVSLSIFSYLLSCLLPLRVLAQTNQLTDTVKAPITNDSIRVKADLEPLLTFIRFGTDISKFVALPMVNSYQTFEFISEGSLRKGLFAVLEGGWGRSDAANDVLSYTSQNIFFRAGIDKPFFKPEFTGDQDNVSMGLRYGVGFVNRQEAKYLIQDPIWGNQQGVIPADKYLVHWLELTAGFRLEIIRKVFVGWTIRGRTLINPGSMEQLPPVYVAGYGRGDKNTAFGYNFFVLIGLHRR